MTALRTKSGLAVHECSECLVEIAAVFGEQLLGLLSRNLELVHNDVHVLPFGVDRFFSGLDGLAIVHELS